LVVPLPGEANDRTIKTPSYFGMTIGGGRMQGTGVATLSDDTIVAWVVGRRVTGWSPVAATLAPVACGAACG
jgi:hypothetical protein